MVWGARSIFFNSTAPPRCVCPPPRSKPISGKATLYSQYLGYVQVCTVIRGDLYQWNLVHFTKQPITDKTDNFTCREISQNIHLYFRKFQTGFLAAFYCWLCSWLHSDHHLPNRTANPKMMGLHSQNRSYTKVF